MGKRFKNSLIYFLARLGIGFLRLFSFERSQRVGAALGGWAYRLAGRVRRDCLAHLKLAFPQENDHELWRLGREVFCHFGMAAAEVLNVAKLPDLKAFMRLPENSRQVLRAGLEHGRGVIYVTGHVGNWELMAWSLVAHGFPIHAIGRRSYDPRFTRLLDGFRSQGGVQTIWRGDPDVMPRMIEALHGNGVLGLLIDQDTKVLGVHVPFFDRLAYTPNSAAWLARKTGAAVVIGFNTRSPAGGYDIHIEEFVPCIENDLVQAVAQDTARQTARIQEHIQEHPKEWVWMHKRWKTPPNRS